ncbi:MAG TPA: molybdopterin-dependent oxidoreductase [Micropepsaceae bacterium]|jgi:DMSO/TMAO reductase YedYZ molybdopterin-dependent catalytic subunit|nr:molybdopterin-dependent oxidoreductase [Micropepsaceae bacterium]
MNMSRRETMQLSATALAALSFAAIRSSTAAAQAAAAPQPDSLVDTRLRTISPLPLNPDGSAPEHAPQEAGPITGVLWKSKGTPDIEFDYRKMKIKVDSRGTAKLSGTLSFSDLEKLPPHSQITLLQCGAAQPKGIVKWTGVRFSDFAKSVGAQPFASYGRFVASDGYVIDEDMTTLMHPQVMLAWMINDKPIPPENGAPLRLVVPFRYGARSLKAIREIQFTATSFPPPPPLPA